MKALLRIVAVGLGLVLLVALGLFAYLKFAFDPNDFRAQLAREVQARTGRELHIDGDLRLSVFPWIGVELGAVRLGNAAGFTPPEFARIGAAQVRARLVPLLSGRVEVDRVRLDGLVLNLERDAQGRTNWADLAGQPSAAPPSGADDRSETAGGAPLPPLVLGGVDLNDAQIAWRDRRSGADYLLSGVALHTGRLAPGEATPVEVSARLTSVAPAVEAALHLRGEARVDTAAGRHALGGLAVELDASGAGVPGGKAALRLGGDLAADLVAGTAEIRRLSVAAYGVEAAGDARIEGLNAAPKLTATLAVGEFSPRTLVAALGGAMPPPADPAALTRASMSARIDAASDGARLSDLVLKLDDSRFEGQLAVTDYAAPALSFDLALDAIDLDRYRASPGSGAEKAGPGAPAGESAVPAIPERLSVQGEFRIGALRVSGLALSDIRLPLGIADGRAMLRPEATLYQGRYRGNIGVDGRGQSIGLSLDETLSGVHIGPLTRDLTGKPERVTGVADITARLTSSGRDAEAIKRRLNGQVKLHFADGAVKGVNVAAFMRQAEALLTGKTAPAESGPNQTDFTALDATVVVADGVARNDDLNLQSPLLRVGGVGSADLGSERIDYLVRASVVGTLTGQGGKPLDKVRGVTVPLRVSGSFDDPKYALDTEALLSDNVKQKLDEKKKEIRQKAKDKLQDELQKGLGRLFR